MCEYKGYKIYKVYKDAYINNVFALEEYDLKRKNVENTIEKLKIKLKYVMN